MNNVNGLNTYHLSAPVSFLQWFYWWNKEEIHSASYSTSDRDEEKKRRYVEGCTKPNLFHFKNTCISVALPRGYNMSI